MFFKYFESSNNINNFSLIELLDNYIFEDNVEGQFDGDIEISAACKLFNLRIIILLEGFIGYNVYNIFTDDDYNIDIYNTIYLLFINENHFNYLKIKINENKIMKCFVIINII